MKTLNEVIEEMDEDLQLQSNLKLTNDELKILKSNGILFLPTDRLKPYVDNIQKYLRETDVADRVWTIYKATDISSNQLGFYTLALTIDLDLDNY